MTTFLSGAPSRARRGPRLLAGLVLALAACGDGGGGGGNDLVVNDPVTRVELASASATVQVGGTLQVTATAYTFTGQVAIGRSVSWSSSNEAVATVSGTGMVTAVAAGAATIRARVQDATGSTDITVAVVPVASVTVAPETATLVAGTTATLTATSRDAGGTPLAGRAVTWTPLEPAIATVNAQGVVTAVSAGTGRIVAAAEGKADTATITVIPAVAAVEVAPSAPTLVVGGTAQLTATARDAGGAALTGRAVAWTALDPSIATVNAQGVVTAVAPGQGRIVATVEGRTAQVTVTVNPAPVNAVTVTPATATIQINGTVQLSASARDANNNPLTGRAVAWTALDPSVAVVSASGVVTGVALGQARMVGTVEGKADTSTITVANVPVATVEVTPAAATVQQGETVQLAAAAKDAGGAALTGRAVAWSALDPSIATVSAQGVVTAVAPGQGRIVATVEGKTAQAAITVTAPVPARIVVSPRFAVTSIGAATALSATTFTPRGSQIPNAPVEFTASSAALAVVETGQRTASVTGSIPGAFYVEAEARTGVVDTATIAVLGSTSLLSTAFAGGEVLRSVQAGATITVPVTLDLSRVSANGDLGSAQFEVRYDPALLTFTGHTAGVAGGVLEANSPSAGTVRVAYANTSAIGSSQVTLVNLTFQVAAGAAAGTRRALALSWTAAPTSTSFAAYEVPVSVGGRVEVAAPSAAARRARRGP
jgi:uncharacterized protein YjdB